MAKREWGAKHTCVECGTKFYDLRRSPIACPKCGTEVVIEIARPVRRRPPAQPVPPPPAAPPPPSDAETEIEAVADKTDDDTDEVIGDIVSGGDDDLVDGKAAQPGP